MTQTGLNIDFKKFSDLNVDLIDKIYEYENIWKNQFKIVLTKIKFNYVMFQIRRLGYLLYIEEPISCDEVCVIDHLGWYNKENFTRITYGERMIIGSKPTNYYLYKINKQNVRHLYFQLPDYGETKYELAESLIYSLKKL
jgi:hypothetical protein